MLVFLACFCYPPLWWVELHIMPATKAIIARMEISMDKSTVKDNTIGHSRVKIHINEVQLKEVTSFQYLSATLSKDGSCTADICIRTSSTTTTDYGTTTVSALPPSTGGTNLPSFPSFCTVVRCGLCLVSTSYLLKGWWWKIRVSHGPVYDIMYEHIMHMLCVYAYLL